MARLNGTTMGIWEPFESLGWWCMMVLGLGALLYLMTRKKKTRPISPPPLALLLGKGSKKVLAPMIGRSGGQRQDMKLEGRGLKKRG
ncbi:unnamed protein product, partial [Ilex paraguariensis]